MVIYSIVPVEVVFSQQDKFEKKTKYISYKGNTLEVTPMSESQYRIERIVGTSLEAYLDPNIQPGGILDISKDIKPKHW